MSAPFVVVGPSQALPEADHALLVRVAWQRAGTRMLAALAVVAGGAVAVGAVAVLSTGTHLATGACAVVALAAVAGAALMPREQRGVATLPLMSGADRATRRQVLRGVRRGIPLTGRLGVLAEDCARRIRTRRLLPGVYAVVAGAIASAGVSQHGPVRLVVLAGAVALLGAAAGWAVMGRQASRYLVAIAS